MNSGSAPHPFQLLAHLTQGIPECQARCPVSSVLPRFRGDWSGDHLTPSLRGWSCTVEGGSAGAGGFTRDVDFHGLSFQPPLRPSCSPVGCPRIGRYLPGGLSPGTLTAARPHLAAFLLAIYSMGADTREFVAACSVHSSRPGQASTSSTCSELPMDSHLHRLCYRFASL